MTVLGGRFRCPVPVRFSRRLAAGGVAAVVAGGTLICAAAIPAAAQTQPAYLFVTNAAASSVTEYAQGASGNATPIATISGPNTGLDIPLFAAVDASGHLFVTNQEMNLVLEFAPGASGNATPIATISGPSTGLDRPNGLAVDASGDLFVANSGAPSVTEYAPGANGNATPIATIAGPSTGLSTSTAVALDASGNLFVTNTSSMTEFAPGANGDVAPIVTIDGPNAGFVVPRGVAVDASGNVFVSTQEAVLEFAPGASGNVLPNSTIQGPNTGLDMGGLAMDALGNLFVASQAFNSVVEFPPGASGNVTPIATIAGASTGLAAPFSVAVAPPAVPGAPNGVSAVAGNTQVSVAWTAPAANGGSAITGYTVSAQAGGTTISQTVNNPSATTAIVGGLTNGTPYTVTVAAINAIGTGPAAAFSGNPVTPTAAAPLITSSNGLVVGVGQNLSFKVTAVGKPRPAITASGLPNWLTFTPAATGGSATVAGGPPAGSGGVYPISFSASNGVGFTAAQNASLSVLEFTSPASATFPLNQSDSVTVMTSLSSPSVSIALSSGSLPPNVSFIVNGNGTATLSGVPTGKAKTYSMTFKATFGTAVTTQKFILTTTN